MRSDIVYGRIFADFELPDHTGKVRITSVTELYGPEQTRLAAEDWLEELDLMDIPPRSEVLNWPRFVRIDGEERGGISPKWLAYSL